MITGTMLVSGSYDQTVVLWDAENCGPKLTLKVTIVSGASFGIKGYIQRIVAQLIGHCFQMWTVKFTITVFIPISAHDT